MVYNNDNIVFFSILRLLSPRVIMCCSRHCFAVWAAMHIALGLANVQTLNRIFILLIYTTQNLDFNVINLIWNLFKYFIALHHTQFNRKYSAQQ